MKKNLEAGLIFFFTCLEYKLISMIAFDGSSNGHSNIARPTAVEITGEGALWPRQTKPVLMML